jgi:hypothetical protein
MRNDDREIEELRGSVSCATLLERAGWRLDRRESTRRALKYRRGPGEILVVTHDGRGWWDPTRATGDRLGRGDVFHLVQRLEPGLNFGQVRVALRSLVGIAPRHPPFARAPGKATTSPHPAERWVRARVLQPQGRAWRYLAKERAIPRAILLRAGTADAVREGDWGTPWFAHRTADGSVTHVELRGPRYRSSLAGGEKTLFRLPGSQVTGADPRRLVVTEAPIDALSVAALENLRDDTLYLATGGGIGPGTQRALLALLRSADGPPPLLLAASDNDEAGERHAAALGAIAADAGGPSGRLAPPAGNDWNDALREAGARP